MLQYSQFFLYLAVSSTSATMKWSKCERNAILLADIGECLPRYGSVSWCPGLYNLWRAFSFQNITWSVTIEQYKSDFYDHTSPCHWDRLRATKFVLTIFFIIERVVLKTFFLTKEPREKRRAIPDFFPRAHTCSNMMHLPRGTIKLPLPPDEELFTIYDYAFKNSHFGAKW